MVLEYLIRGIKTFIINAKREYNYFELCVWMFKNTMSLQKKPEKHKKKTPVHSLLFLTRFSRDELFAV